LWLAGKNWLCGLAPDGDAPAEGVILEERGGRGAREARLPSLRLNRWQRNRLWLRLILNQFVRCNTSFACLAGAPTDEKTVEAGLVPFRGD